MPHEPPEASLDHDLSRTSVPAPKKIQMKPFKRSHTGPKRLNALGMAGALDDSGTPDVSADSDNEYSLVDEDGTRAQRFATDLQGNRFREVSVSLSLVPKRYQLVLGDVAELTVESFSL